MPVRTDLLVIGAGPYAYSAAAFARDNGIDTRVVGRPMAVLARAHAGRHVPALRAGLAPRRRAASTRSRRTSRTAGCDRADLDPIPIGGLPRLHRLVPRAQGARRRPAPGRPTWPRPDGAFVATMDDGSTITADKVLAAPGHPALRQPAGLVRRRARRRAARTPATWSPSTSSPGPGSWSSAAGRAPTSGRRCCATTAPSGSTSCTATPTPDFAQVSWAFVDRVRRPDAGPPRLVAAAPGRAAAGDRAEFWQVGRLTLEPWLVPRLPRDVVTSHPGARSPTWRPATRDVTLTLSDGTALTADHVVFASGYRADLDDPIERRAALKIARTGCRDRA